MGARIVGILVAVLIAVGIYYGYQHYHQEKALESGAVHCVGCMSPEEEAKFKRQNAGDEPVPAGEHSESRAPQTASENATPAQEPAGGVPQGTGPQSMAGQGQNAAPAGGTLQNGAQARGSFASASTAASVSTAPPATDSQGPNAPNGARFGGTGTYQWYRQGNLTWRVDTASGRSCIVYATMDEWRKQIVMSHGCGRDA